MDKEFKRLKRYNATWMLLRALAVGASLALLLVGGIMMLTKMHKLDAGALHYVGSALAGVVAAVVYWLLLKRSDLRIAEKIDAEHKLKERVQTMVEYRDENSAMLQVQREDTEARLKAVRKFGQKKLVLAGHFLAVVVAVAVFAAGVVMPVQAIATPPKPTEPPFEAAEWQKAALEELIAYVEKSDMVAEARDPVVAKLWELREALDAKLSTSGVQQLAIAAIRYIYEVADNVNSNDDIHDIIEEKVDHPQAGNLAYALGAIGNREREGDIATIGTNMASDENLKTLTALAAMLDDALHISTFGANDPLYVAVANVAAKLKEAGAAMDAGDVENAQNLLGIAFNDLKNEASAALTQQDINKEECEHVINQLCKIFGISDMDRPSDPDEKFTREKQDDKVDSVPGGAGPGEMEYAGTDLIYDYETGEYVPYGPLLDRYMQRMLQKIQDGTLPEEMQEFVRNYFQELYNGANVGTKDEE